MSVRHRTHCDGHRLPTQHRAASAVTMLQATLNWSTIVRSCPLHDRRSGAGMCAPEQAPCRAACYARGNAVGPQLRDASARVPRLGLLDRGLPVARSISRGRVRSPSGVPTNRFVGLTRAVAGGLESRCRMAGQNPVPRRLVATSLRIGQDRGFSPLRTTVRPQTVNQ